MHAYQFLHLFAEFSIAGYGATSFTSFYDLMYIPLDLNLPPLYEFMFGLNGLLRNKLFAFN